MSTPNTAVKKTVVKKSAKKATAKATTPVKKRAAPAASATATAAVPPVVPPVIPPTNTTTGGTSGAGGAGQPAGGHAPPPPSGWQRIPAMVVATASQAKQLNMGWWIAGLVVLIVLLVWFFSGKTPSQQLPSQQQQQPVQQQMYPDDAPTARMSLPAMRTELAAKVAAFERMKKMHHPKQETIWRLQREADALQEQIIELEGQESAACTTTTGNGRGGFHAVIDAPQDGHVALTYEGTEAYKARLNAETCQAQIKADANRPNLVLYGSRRLGALRYQP